MRHIHRFCALANILQRESAYLRFRWTPSHFRTFAAYFIIFPGALYMAHSYVNVRSLRPSPAHCLRFIQERYNWRGARRGIPLEKAAAAVPAAEE